jgi:two-component system, sensor histidine kinase and response regulator
MEITAPHLRPRETDNAASEYPPGISLAIIKNGLLRLLTQVKRFGFSPEMEEYEQRKLQVFNLLIFLQLIAGIIIPLTAIVHRAILPAGAWLVTSLPAFVSFAVLYLNYNKRYDVAAIVCFLAYPFVTCLIYLYGINPGTSLFFILHGVLSVFFLKDTGYMIFSLCFSLVSYFLLAVAIKHYPYELYNMNSVFYFFNQGIAIAFIFYGLFLIKKENSGYQSHILHKNTVLQEKNREITQQSENIELNTARLKQQAAELEELNALKNKMFGIISHDLKAPIYGLRTLFQQMQEKKMTASELKKSVPDIQKDLNYVVGLMDNLLQWAKVQMQSDAVYLREVDLQKTIQETLQLLSQPAKFKQITITDETVPGIIGYADRDMISLVIRNLVSNAIKFTPEYGTIAVGVNEHPSFLEVYVKDSGAGINKETLLKISNNDFFTTPGTASESGTGLGLMLCKEFLQRNGSRLHIETEPGNGSIFSFSLQRSA